MSTPSRPRRADAERNRLVLLEAARHVFARRGLDAPMDDVAQAAGVGNATLYRHFPSRCELVVAAFTQQVEEYAAAVERAVEDPDPWHGLETYLTTICALQADNRGLADLLTTTHITNPTLARLRARARRNLRVLIERAQQAGELRSDFTAQDVILILMANAGVIRHTASHAPTGSPRLVALLLDGLRAAAATPGARAPSEQSLLKAMAGPD